jgi:hypothetical protein
VQCDNATEVPPHFRAELCPGRKPPFLVVRRPALLYKTRHREMMHCGKYEGRLHAPGGPGRLSAGMAWPHLRSTSPYLGAMPSAQPCMG